MSIQASETAVVQVEYTVEQVCDSPSVFIIRNLMTEAECQHFIETAKDDMRPSTTVDPQTGEFIVIKDRSSTVTFFKIQQDPIIAAVEQRIADLVNMPIENGEGLQVLRYQIGQEYKPHYDFFDPTHPGSVKVLEKGGQRVATVLMYLSEVEEGGETVMPRINFTFYPTPKDALLFYNMDSCGVPHQDSLHGSVPVIKGEKWVSTKWLRERAYR